MNKQQRYSVPLTVNEIQALMESLNWRIEERHHHSSAIAVLEDVYSNCCESEVIAIADNSTSVKGEDTIS